MPTYTLADLRTPQTQAVIAARIKAAISARYTSLSLPDPTPAWTPTASGGPENTAIDMIAGTLATLVGVKMAQAVAGRFLDLAQGDDLTYLAKHFYLLDRSEATKTIQDIALSSVPEAAQESFAAGELWVASNATGHRYVNVEAVDLPPNSFGVHVPFEAELVGAAYSDPLHTIDTMVVAPAGVSCTNEPTQDFLDTVVKGSSTGTVTAFFGDVLPPFDSIRVQIWSSGDIGTALFKYSLDGGLIWSDASPIAPTFAIPGVVDGCTLRFADGTTPSFIEGDIFTLLVAGPILQQGRDQESDSSLRSRCRARWTSLSLVPTEGLVTLWAQLASPEVHKVLVDADPNTPGGILVTIASAAGPASAAAQIAVDDYITARLLGFKGVPEASAGAGAPEETVQVRSAVRRQITPSGTVDVPRTSVTAVQQAADRLWQAYLADVEIGGTVILAELEQQLMDAGAITFSGILLNGVNQNLALGANEVAVPADGTSLTANLTWRPASGSGGPVPTAEEAAPPAGLAFAARNEIEATLLAFLQDPDFPVTDWNSGAVMRTILELQTEFIDDLIGRVDSTIPFVLTQGWADLADGDWLTAVARGIYGIARGLGTVATQTVTLAASASAGTNVFTAGTRVFLATNGQRYVTASGGTLSPSGTLAIDVTGESPGAAQGLVNRLESPLAGVSVVSSAIKIVSTVSQYGSDDETDTALMGRCLGRWPELLELLDTMDRAERWARAASTEVTRLRMDADSVNPGGVIVTVAGVSGAVSGGAVTAVQNYIDQRAPITDYITAQNATNLTITASADVTVPLARLAEIQAAANASWNAYLASAQIGGKVYRARLLQAVMDAGAIDIQVLHLNGFGVDVSLSSTQVPVPDAAGLAALLNWIVV